MGPDKQRVRSQTPNIVRTFTVAERKLPIVVKQAIKLSRLKRITTRFSTSLTKIPSIRMLTKRQLLILLVVIVAIIGAMIYIIVSSNSSQNNPDDQSSSTTGATSHTPTYSTVLPANKNIKQLGGWTRVSPPSSNPVFAYADTIDSTAITVSEQPLPDSFKSDPNGQIDALSQHFNAKNTFDAGGTTVHIGTSLKGPQSLILIKNNLLVLITSATKIDNAKWIEYITNLR
jgi:hypothetical protein